MNDFPVLTRKVHGKRLIYLDSAATSQKPRQVIDAISNYYESYNSNVHRGVHTLSQEATDAYEEARSKVAKFINATREEIIFTKNTSESSNLVLYSWAMKNLKAGDEVITSVMEHHSNLVPWQQLTSQGVKVLYLDIDNHGELRMDQLKKLLTRKTKLVCLAHASSVLGTINPIAKIAKMAHFVGAKIYVDGAQAAPHLPVDVRKLDADFYSFSAHKMLGPTGVGVLYGKRAILEKMPPFLFGGDMIREVTLEGTRFNDLPYKFEAGTPNIADTIAFGFAIDYLTAFGMANVQKHEQELVAYALPKLLKIKGLTLHGPQDPKKRVGVLAFSLIGIHPHDMASILDAEGVAIRSGHICCQPLMKRLGIDSVARASTYIYNTKEDIDVLIEGIKKVQEVFA